jgi:hypothetical protein
MGKGLLQVSLRPSRFLAPDRAADPSVAGDGEVFSNDAASFGSLGDQGITDVTGLANP